MKSLWIAFVFLTRIPVPRVDATVGMFARSVRYYPLVGLVIGAIVAGAGWCGAWLHPWVGGLTALLAWVWVTGALHLDGLGDLADGLGALHGDRTRLLAVMADPHIGSFGVMAIVLQVLCKLVLLSLLLPAHWFAIILIPAMARLGPLFWARYLRPLRPGGLGAAMAGAIRSSDLILGGVALILASVTLPWLAVAPIILAAIGLWFRWRTGGVTGDMHGAGIEIAESLLLLACVVQAAR